MLEKRREWTPTRPETALDMDLDGGLYYGRGSKSGVERANFSYIVDRELDRVLGHEGWAIEFPKTRRYQDFLSRVCAGPEGSRPKPSRAPPGQVLEADGSQVDPRGERWEGRQEGAGDWPA